MTHSDLPCRVAKVGDVRRAVVGVGEAGRGVTVDTTDDYEAFLRRKFDFHADYGFDVDEADLSPCLLPHQRDIVRWAVKGGRRALFEAFGLGKSVQQLEILRLILARLSGQGERARGLVVCPLGVRQEFTRDARNLLGLGLRFLRRDSEVAGDGLYITNYESIRDGRLDPDLFDAVSLDEASVLRSFGSKTYQTFLGLFGNARYRFVATATPSPNRYKELIHYAGFLGVMDTGQALTRFFQRDSTQANNLTLYPHKTDEFFVWLHSWAIFLQSPADICKCGCHNPGDLVYDPFAGLGTVPMRALRAGRRGRGVELNPEYFADSVRYPRAEEMRVGVPGLFDLVSLDAMPGAGAEVS